MTVMMITDFSVILYISGQIGCHKFLYITAASSDDLDALGFQNILRPLSHISGKHHSNSHLPEDRSDTALASATFR